MRRPIAAACTALLACLIGSVAAAAAAPTFVPCPQDSNFACTTVTVPLSRSSLAQGSIKLTVEREQTGMTQSHSAVVALAGGPGQAALGLADFMSKAMAPALVSRDFIVFDQRGTGHSGALSCNALNSSFSSTSPIDTLGRIAEQCAVQLGQARGAYTSEESVADIEALRQALGYEKLVLYGTSYGTKVAELYAERYPQNVEALVLDSVVTPDGPEPFAVASFQAIIPTITELCSHGACRGITTAPMADLSHLAARLRTHRLSGYVYDGFGHRHSAKLSEQQLLEILQAGDLNPALRALLPAAVHSALRKDPDPLLRLSRLAQGLTPNVPLPPPGTKGTPEEQEEDNALFLATSCEEKPFPWQRGATAAQRNSEAVAASKALPSSDFVPFDAITALQSSMIPFCASWPDASPSPSAQTPLPNVPTLILSGANDLRTPTANARQVAAAIPDAQVLVVPHTGHSVLGADFSGCAQNAVDAFFTGTAIQPCRSTSNMFAPTPVTPTSLKFLKPVKGLSGKPGRTLTAVLDTMVDLSRQVIGATLQAEQNLPTGSSFGGLHGGFAALSESAVQLRELAFIPGVHLTGTLPVRNGALQPATITVSGPAAARGSVRIDSSQRVRGTLGGHRFTLSVAKAKLSSVGAAEWPSHPVISPLGPLARIP